jgi:hypothetical protein
MKTKSPNHLMGSVLLVTALFGGTVTVAILTHYPGLIEFKYKDVQFRIDGSSGDKRSTFLPPIDAKEK